jgi:pimeloyl-ACP methyl ester carboxylesterase
MQKSFSEKPFILRTPQADLAAFLHTASGKSLIVMCHGFTGTKIENGRLFVLTARAFQKAGFNVLRFDFMGSGESSGYLSQMSPNTQIKDVLNVLVWARKRYQKIGLLGLSFGGGTAICASQQARPEIRPDTLITWSAVPSFQWWRTEAPQGDEPQPGNPMHTGKQFFRDRPQVDIPEAYQLLKMPRLQIQGDNDIPEFLERFSVFCPKGDPRVRHLVIPGGDHVFTRWPIRKRVIAESVRWMRKYLA